MKCVGLDLTFWALIKNDLAKAIDYRSTIDDVHQFILDGKVQLWALHDGEISAVMTTEIVCYSQIKAIRVLAVSGENMDLWLDCLIDTLSEWGKEKGAELIEFYGRKGWEKVLTTKGFGETQIFMTRRINHVRT